MCRGSHFSSFPFCRLANSISIFQRRFLICNVKKQEDNFDGIWYKVIKAEEKISIYVMKIRKFSHLLLL